MTILTVIIVLLFYCPYVDTLGNIDSVTEGGQPAGIDSYLYFWLLQYAIRTDILQYINPDPHINKPCYLSHNTLKTCYYCTHNISFNSKATQSFTQDYRDSVDQTASQNHGKDIGYMATGNDNTDHFGDAAEAANGDDSKLRRCSDRKSYNQEREDGDDQFDDECDDNISDRKRKRAHSHTVDGKVQRDDAVAFTLDDGNDLSNKQLRLVSGTYRHYKRTKFEAPNFCGKRISDELDSDDELMMRMREDGFSDRQIAQRLEKVGRVRYDEKSISTRIVRIRQAQAQKVDFFLKEGYKEWKYQDDTLLLQAYSLADIEINYEIERLRAWRFRKVSDYMRRLNKNALFSATACCERYNALVEGTARIPTELDDDPETRRTEMEAYRVAREKARHKEQAEKALQEAAEAKFKDETKSYKAQKAEESANKRAQRETEKAERAMKRAEQAKIRAARAQQNQAAKAHRNAQINKQKTTQTVKKTIPPPAAATAKKKKN